MRLPTLNTEHVQREDARAHHEALYRAFLAKTTVPVAITPETREQVQASESSNGRRFWESRGFRIRTKSNRDNTVLSVWLEVDGRAAELEAARAFRDERRREIAARKEASA